MKYQEYNADKNPARQFYRHWKRALDITGFRSLTIPGTTWGYWHETITGRPAISLGIADGQWPHLRVAADGRFMLRDLKAGWGYGTMRRQMIESNSFLYYCGGWNEYLWMVRAGDDDQSYPWRRVRDHADRIHYVGENLLTWGYAGGVWQELVQIGGEWEMRPARRQDTLLPKGAYTALMERHDNYQARVAKRYERIEREALGIPPKVSAETLRLREERREALLDEHSQQLAALLDVTMPAKTERYTRPKEAHHDHTVATQDRV